MAEQRVSKHWWAMLIRGIVACLFALMAFFWTGLTLEVLVILLGLYLLFDGLFSLIAGLVTVGHKNWWLLILEGIIGLAAAILVFAWPGVTVVILIYLIAVWAIVSGLFELIASIVAHWAIAGKFAIGLSGAISIILGLLLFAMPALGLTAIIWLIGIYALIFGLALISFSFQVRKA